MKKLILLPAIILSFLFSGLELLGQETNELIVDNSEREAFATLDIKGELPEFKVNIDSIISAISKIELPVTLNFHSANVEGDEPIWFKNLSIKPLRGYWYSQNMNAKLQEIDL